MNEKICIVPFTKKEYPLINNLSKTYSCISLVTPKGIGEAGKNISILKNTYKADYEFSNSISDGIKNSDVILITETKKEDRSLYAFALQALQASITAGKEIICFLELEDAELDLYQQQCKESDIEHYFFHNSNQYHVETEEEFKNFNIPIIYISEIIPDCDGYDIFLSLIYQMQSDGKRVLAISQDVYNIMFGQIHMTFWTGTDARKMVYHLNQIVYDLVCSKRPDVLIIRLPEPMMKYDNENTYDFGLTAFLLAQAIPGNGCICCTYTGTPTVGFWGNVNENFTSKFGYPILGVHVSNQIIDITAEKWISTIYIPTLEMEKEIKLLNQYNDLEFYNLLKQEEFNRFYEALNSELFEITYGVIEA